ncbi:MAG: PKD domain-containing protein, partial [Planctomycetes bacterium]|nr:PKD domain-containing protein [Planctomycetota bacterium]
WSSSVEVAVSGVPNRPPTAIFRATPEAGMAPLSVSFDASASTDPDDDALSFHWRFGDGAEGDGRVVAHAFAAAGTYEVTLEVSDGRGGSDEASLSIRVAPGGEVFLRGDANLDGRRDIGDAIVILSHIFSDGPLDCADAGDVSDDGQLDIGDPIGLLNHLFIAPDPLPEPFETPGSDPTADGLDCAVGLSG